MVLGLAIFTVMSTWKRGRELLIESHARRTTPSCCRSSQALAAERVQRAPRTAVYTVANPTRCRRR